MIQLWTTLWAEVTFEFEGWDTGGLFVLILLGLGVYFLYVQLSAADGRRARRDDSILPSSLSAPSPEKAKPLFAANAAPTTRQTRHALPGCKRKHKRRTGNPVDIQVSRNAGQEPVYAGVVLDRSRGGLLISTERPAMVGNILAVRAVHTPDAVGWVQVQVRHAKQKDGRHFLGCAFMEDLPWGTVLLFG